MPDFNEEQLKKIKIYLDHYQFFDTLIQYGLHEPKYPQYILFFNKFGMLKGVEAKISIERCERDFSTT